MARVSDRCQRSRLCIYGHAFHIENSLVKILRVKSGVSERLKRKLMSTLGTTQMIDFADELEVCKDSMKLGSNIFRCCLLMCLESSPTLSSYHCSLSCH